MVVFAVEEKKTGVETVSVTPPCLFACRVRFALLNEMVAEPVPVEGLLSDMQLL